MISSLTKVMGLQSSLLLEKKEDQNCLDIKKEILGIGNVINVTAVMIIVISLIIFKYGGLLLLLVANKFVVHGLPILNFDKMIFMGKP